MRIRLKVPTNEVIDDSVETRIAFIKKMLKIYYCQLRVLQDYFLLSSSLDDYLGIESEKHEPSEKIMKKLYWKIKQLEQTLDELQNFGDRRWDSEPID